MGSLRPLNVRLLRWRTRPGRATAIRNLDLLAVAVQAKSYRYVKLYQADELPARPPLLWVFALSPDDHVRVAVSVHAVPGGGWAYYDAGRGRRGYLSPCGDTKRAADHVDALLKHRMFPSTW
ncbi:hypothetical protein [Actinomadura livida]|uniref:Uncharacterized protein n=1 Tax=Actinomadura livida TaxID=79909 RepID=A0A7W7I831_9ACTN|nr:MULTISPECIES: hypothetical protein [Actinomadura]MBB4772168.1 hypothetical protein [Actinomadura catellatispora]GGU27390.1 hypothetical protein GCM10010208_60240 [Actinomadura livida]